MPTLDRNSRLPLHIQLRDLLQREIVEGAYRPGAAFPTEREISERFHVSRTTIREALSELVRLGHLVRQQGKGTFVARTHDAFDATQLSSFTEDMRRRGFRAGARLLEFERCPAAGPARRHFGGGAGELWRVRRLRFADDEPIALQTSFLPADRFRFDERELTDASLYGLLAERHGVFVARADEVIAAAVASAEQAALLALEGCAALLCVERFAYSQTGEPIEYAEIQYRADRYTFFVHQSRGG